MRSTVYGKGKANWSKVHCRPMTASARYRYDNLSRAPVSYLSKRNAAPANLDKPPHNPVFLLLSAKALYHLDPEIYVKTPSVIYM